MIHYVTGNLLESEAQTLVNAVNTVGVMGKGIALQFKKAFPNNFNEIACEIYVYSPSYELQATVKKGKVLPKHQQNVK